MIKLSLQEALTANEAMQRLPKLPIKASYRLARIRDKMLPDFKIFEEQRNAILKEHGVEAGVKLSDEVTAALNTKIAELLSADIEIGIDPLSLSECGPIDIEPSVVMALGKVITE